MEKHGKIEDNCLASFMTSNWSSSDNPTIDNSLNSLNNSEYYQTVRLLSKKSNITKIKALIKLRDEMSQISENFIQHAISSLISHFKEFLKSDEFELKAETHRLILSIIQYHPTAFTTELSNFVLEWFYSLFSPDTHLNEIARNAFCQFFNDPDFTLQVIEFQSYHSIIADSILNHLKTMNNPASNKKVGMFSNTQNKRILNTTPHVLTKFNSIEPLNCIKQLIFEKKFLDLVAKSKELPYMIDIYFQILENNTAISEEFGKNLQHFSFSIVNNQPIFIQHESVLKMLWLLCKINKNFMLNWDNSRHFWAVFCAKLNKTNGNGCVHLHLWFSKILDQELNDSFRSNLLNLLFIHVSNFLKFIQRDKKQLADKSHLNPLKLFTKIIFQSSKTNSNFIQQEQSFLNEFFCFLFDCLLSSSEKTAAILQVHISFVQEIYKFHEKTNFSDNLIDIFYTPLLNKLTEYYITLNTTSQIDSDQFLSHTLVLFKILDVSKFFDKFIDKFLHDSLTIFEEFFQKPHDITGIAMLPYVLILSKCNKIHPHDSQSFSIHLNIILTHAHYDCPLLFYQTFASLFSTQLNMFQQLSTSPIDYPIAFLLNTIKYILTPDNATQNQQYLLQFLNRLFSRQSDLMEVIKPETFDDFRDIIERTNLNQTLIQFFIDLDQSSSFFDYQANIKLVDEVFSSFDLSKVPLSSTFDNFIHHWIVNRSKLSTTVPVFDAANRKIALKYLSYSIDNFYHLNTNSCHFTEFINSFIDEAHLDGQEDSFITQLPFDFSVNTLKSLVSCYNFPASFGNPSQFVSFLLTFPAESYKENDDEDILTNKISFIYQFLSTKPDPKPNFSNLVDWFAEFFTVCILHENVRGRAILKDILKAFTTKTVDKLIKSLIDLAKNESLYCVTLFYVLSEDLVTEMRYGLELLDYFFIKNPLNGSLDGENTRNINIMNVFLSTLDRSTDLSFILRYYLHKYNEKDSLFTLITYISFANSLISNLEKNFNMYIYHEFRANNLPVLVNLFSSIINNPQIINVISNDEDNYFYLIYALLSFVRRVLSFYHHHQVSFIDTPTLKKVFTLFHAFIDFMENCKTRDFNLHLLETYNICKFKVSDFPQPLCFCFNSVVLSTVPAQMLTSPSTWQDTLFRFEECLYKYLEANYHGSLIFNLNNSDARSYPMYFTSRMIQLCEDNRVKYCLSLASMNSREVGPDCSYYFPEIRNGNYNLSEFYASLLESFLIKESIYQPIYSNKFYYLNQAVYREISAGYKFLTFLNHVIAIFASLPGEDLVKSLASVENISMFNAVLAHLLSVIPLTDNKLLKFKYDVILSVKNFKSYGNYAFITLVNLLSSFPMLLRSYVKNVRLDEKKKIVNFYKKRLAKPVMKKYLENVQDYFKGDSLCEIITQGTRHEVKVRIYHNEDSFDCLITFPDNFPLGKPIVTVGSRGAVKTAWLDTQKLNLSIVSKKLLLVEAIKKWKEMIEKKMVNAKQCVICYLVFDDKDMSLVEEECSVCHNAVHKSCLQRWFETSNKKTCPVCRSIFY